MMPVLRSVACAGIGPVTDLRFCVAFFGGAGSAAGAAGAAVGIVGFAPPIVGLRIIGLRMTGLSLIVETPAVGDAAAPAMGAGSGAGAGAGAGAGTGAGAGVGTAPNGDTLGGRLPPSSGLMGVISTSSDMSFSNPLAV